MSQPSGFFSARLSAETKMLVCAPTASTAAGEHRGRNDALTGSSGERAVRDGALRGRPRRCWTATSPPAPFCHATGRLWPAPMVTFDCASNTGAVRLIDAGAVSVALKAGAPDGLPGAEMPTLSPPLKKATDPLTVW